MSAKKIYQLSDIGKSLQNMIEKHYQSGFWIKAEISKLNYYPKTGHCFPDLVERKNGKIKAQMRSIIWSIHYQKILKNFEQIAKTSLTDGMQILFRAKVTYHQTYGFSLQILRIDPQFTLGQLAVEKEQCIQRLQKEKLYYANKSLVTPLLIKRLAIISYNTSKGYLDFLNIIDQHKDSFNLHYQLFPSLLQGDRAENQLIEQLQLIEQRKSIFDAVCILRGGGGEVGMNCYNSYEVAKTLSKMSIPVYTGIGHSTNETVCEMIAHKNCITPTDFAYEVIQKFKDYALRTKEAQVKMQDLVLNLFTSEKAYLIKTGTDFQRLVKNLVKFQYQHLYQLSNRFPTGAPRILKKAYSNLQQIKNGITRQPLYTLRSANQHMEHQKRLLKIWSSHLLERKLQLLKEQEQRVQYLSPEQILKRGYSILMKDGKIVTEFSKLQKGDTVINQTHYGIVESKINSIKTNKKDEV